jgi:hypothetical protein
MTIIYIISPSRYYSRETKAVFFIFQEIHELKESFTIRKICRILRERRGGTTKGISRRRQ